MKNILFLLALTSGLRAAWYEGTEENSTEMRVRGGGGGYKRDEDRHKEEHDHKVADHATRQDLYVPCCYGRSKPVPIPERRLSTNPTQNPIVYTHQDVSIVDLRGSLESQNVDLRRSRQAQNIDVGPQRRGVWEWILSLCDRWRSRRNVPLLPPRLERHMSYYPGRSDTHTDPFREK